MGRDLRKKRSACRQTVHQAPLNLKIPAEICRNATKSSVCSLFTCARTSTHPSEFPNSTDGLKMQFERRLERPISTRNPPLLHTSLHSLPPPHHTPPTTSHYPPHLPPNPCATTDAPARVHDCLSYIGHRINAAAGAACVVLHVVCMYVFFCVQTE